MKFITKKGNFSFFLVVFVFINLAVSLLYVGNAAAATYHSTDITTYEYWGSGDIHIVTKDIIVRSGGQLEIGFGATVQFKNNCKLRVEGGRITAVGGANSGQEITFTSTKTFPTPGSW